MKKSPRNPLVFASLVHCTAALLTACASTTTVTPVAEVTQAGRGGVLYALPKTALDVEVPFVRVEKTHGKFWDQADELFGEPATITSDSVSFAVGVPTIAALGLPDEAKVFRAEIKGGPLSDSSMTLQFDNKGILTSSIGEAENRTVDFVISTLEASARIATSAAKFASKGTEQNSKQFDESRYPGITEAFKRARAAQDFVKDIVRGEVTSDLSTFQARLAKANEMLAEAMAPFYGKVEKETWNIQFRVVPARPDRSPIALFSYRKNEGITAFVQTPRNKRQAQFMAKGTGADKGVATSVVSVGVTSSPLVADKLARQILFAQRTRGIHYNIPAFGTIAVFDDQNRLVTANASFGQFGSVGFLPVSTGSRKLHQEVTLDGTSGALLRMQNSSNSFDSQLVNRAGEGIGKGLDAFDPQTKAERESAIAKARLEKLETDKKIEELKEPPASSTTN